MEEKAITQKPAKLYTALSMNRAKKIANELTKFLDNNNLTMNIAGKKYVPVEGWQFVGETQMNLTSIIVSCDPVETEGKEVKYKAVVEVVNQQGTVISRGFAWCSDQEKKKKGFEEYAVASMAQTRAVGKAYRNILAWIIKMGGYEPTPYEEVDPELMEADLARAKQNIVKVMKDQGITNSQDMMANIQSAIGKDMVENTDEANKVLEYLNREAD